DAFYLSTGHYAKAEHDLTTGRYVLKKSVDNDKDQSYALYNLTQFQLEHTLFPLGYYTKKEIRYIAEELDLSVADKPDSQEICFVNTNYREFISEKAPNKIEEGPFVDIKGNVIGKHKGIPFYTIGQRRGLGISAGKPLYVINIDVKNNAVVLGEKKHLYVKEFLAYRMNWVAIGHLSKKMQVKAKIRYNFNEKPAEITPVDDDTVKVVFNEPQKAVTPGQAVVFYNDDIVVGGGIIKQRCDLE
ncbi:MAG TPA: tRNA 2-thiouridine(34) synthase MnmA, partial [Thermoanaerobacterales bacterium]|nr:tRNA 2-thiouridine(34) synthase MnmA [Thermoanaerobacterales bacterium]